MVPVFLVFRTNGDVYVAHSLADARSLTSIANIFEIANAPLQRVATYSGTGSPYTVTPGSFDASRNHVKKIQ
jgi:hypothetical protein